MAKSLESVHEEITGGRFGVFRVQVKIGSSATSAGDVLEDGRLVYRAEWDVSDLEEVRRREQEVRDQVGIPSKVSWNGSTYRFKFRTRSIRESGGTRGRWFKIYDGGYKSGHSLRSLEWATALANASGSIQVRGKEYEFDGLFWSQSSGANKCPKCGRGVPDPISDEDGGLVSNSGVLGKEDFSVCLGCALEAIGEDTSSLPNL